MLGGSKDGMTACPSSISGTSSRSTHYDIRGKSLSIVVGLSVSVSCGAKCIRKYTRHLQPYLQPVQFLNVIL